MPHRAQQEAIRQFIERFLPLCGSKITVRLRGADGTEHKKTFCVPDTPPAVQPSVDQNTTIPPQRPGRCRADLIRVFSVARLPMTTSQVMTAMSALGIELSERTISGELAKMVDEGILNLGSNGQGYRMPQET